MRILILEDDQTRARRFGQALVGHEVIFAETAAAAIRELAAGARFDLASLDHDLGGDQMKESDEQSGYHVAEFIAEMAEETRPLIVIIHSFNPQGAERMKQTLLQCSNIQVLRLLFGSDDYWRVLASICSQKPENSDE